MGVLVSNLPPYRHISLSYIMGFDIKIIRLIIHPHAQTHHVVIIVINIVIAMLTLCDSPYVTHYTKSLYHSSMLTLQTSLT
jgi:hypothetical protein